LKQIVLQTVLLLAVGGMLNGCVDEDVQAGQSGDTQKPVIEDVDLESPDNQETDLERLSRIQDRLRKVGLAEYAVIFGQDSQSNCHMVAVDYAMFDEFSDDAAACMIVQAMLTQSMQKNHLVQQVDQQGQSLLGREILEVDFKTGQYLARAGFDADGFSEWFQAASDLALPQAAEITDSQRKSRFKKGYQEMMAQTKKNEE
jgi:hypothetical protein